MTNATHAGQWKARIQFFALYLIGIGLIFTVVLGFLRNRGLVESQNAAANVNVQPVQQPSSPGVNEQELEKYKTAIATNSQIIDSLNQRIQQLETTKTVAAPVQQPVASNDGEWKQKYSALKAGYDKASEREAALRAAYKTVADDNKRLLAQLQSLKDQKK